MSFADLRRDYNLIVVAEQAGVQLRGKGSKQWGICPFPDHTHSRRPSPSFSIYDYNGELRFKCHGACGHQGDVIDFIGYMRISGYSPRDNAQKEQAGDILQNGQTQRSPYVVVEKRELLAAFTWTEYVPVAPNVRAYLKGRGISDAVIDECRFGSASRVGTDENPRTVIREPVDRLVSIPTFHAGSLLGVKLRILNGRAGYKYFSHPGSRAGLWNHDEVYCITEPVLVAKGELCGAAMKSAGFTACSITSGERGTTDRMEMFAAMRTALALAKKVYVCDNDATGLEQSLRLAELFNATVRNPPDRFKDWDQWYIADPAECVRVTNQWLEAAAKT